MAIIINFEDRKREKIHKIKTTLSTFKIDTKEIDVEKLYSKISKRYKISMPTTGGLEKEFIRCENEHILFKELSNVVDGFDNDHSAWVVLSEDADYLYLKEEDPIFKSGKEEFKKKIKEITYRYALDYIVILEKVDRNTYRLVAS